MIKIIYGLSCIKFQGDNDWYMLSKIENLRDLVLDLQNKIITDQSD